MVQIERLQEMAKVAVAEYNSALRAGGEPDYPQWAEDILMVCRLAEESLAGTSAPLTFRRRERSHHVQ
jgi:hypothetical protein